MAPVKIARPSYAGGAAKILWKEAGTGTKWAIVRFPICPLVEYDGKLDGALSAGGSATMSIWEYTSSWQDSTKNETVYAPPILSSGSIASGKWVSAVWKRQPMRLEIVGREC